MQNVNKIEETFFSVYQENEFSDNSGLWIRIHFLRIRIQLFFHCGSGSSFTKLRRGFELKLACEEFVVLLPNLSEFCFLFFITIINHFDLPS